MKDFKKKLEGVQTLLVLANSAKYSTMFKDIPKLLSGQKVCYISLNKTADSLMEIFKKNKIDISHFHFIDAITKSVLSKVPSAPNCTFVSSPRALSELSVAIVKILSQSYDYLIFDSITNLAIYEGKAPVAKFISSVVNRVMTTSTKAIFYALDMKQQQELVQEAAMFVEDQIKYS